MTKKILINLTPHAIHEVNTKITFPPSGNVARVSVSYIKDGEINGIPVCRAEYGSVEGLLELKKDTVYIVSGFVKSAVPERKDVVSPGELVRDESGKPIGCDGFKI